MDISKRLNGWQRIWVVFTVVWTIGLGLLIVWDWEGFGGTFWQAILLLVIPPLILYVAGRTVWWIYRGFRPPTHS
jgi:hypothetical protein